MIGRTIAVAFLMLGLLPAQPIRIKMATLAPKDTYWHQALLQMGERWRQISGGKVSLTVFAGGVDGDEPQMVRMMRVGQLQAAGLSGSGLAQIDRSVNCLQLPLMLDSDAELDWVRERMSPRLEKILESKGFVLLSWSDVGWVYFFTKKPAARPDDLRKMKLFTWLGDNETLELYKASGFHPVPLEATGILMGLQTGLIDSFDVPPLAALANQWFPLAPYMIDLKWAPLVGAMVVSKPSWDRVPEPFREPMLEAARASSEQIRTEVRKLGAEAVTAMQKRGLKVTTLDTAALADWRREVDAIYPKLRGRYVPADLFDEVRTLRNQYRSQGGPTGDRQ